MSNRGRVSVIVEGMDNTGKSTLANKIAAKTGCAVVPSPGKALVKAGRRELLYDALMGELTSTQAPAVFDRFYLSELVYSQLLERPSAFTLHQQDIIETMLQFNKTLVIICIREEEEIRKTWQTDQLFPDIVQRIRQFQEEYLKAAMHYRPYMFVRVVGNWVMQEVVADEAADWLQTATTQQRPPYGRGNWINPRYAIIGEKFARNNKWLVPFERSKSGEMIHEALKAMGVNILDCWFTNAIRSGTALTNMDRQNFQWEMDMVRPKVLLTFGKTARFLAELGTTPYVNFTHPGFYLRKSRPDLFFQEVRDKWRRWL